MLSPDYANAWGEELANALESAGIHDVIPQDGYEALVRSGTLNAVERWGVKRLSPENRVAVRDALEAILERRVPAHAVDTAIERTSIRFPMSSIAIQVDPRRLSNPDADLRYEIPAELARRSNGMISDDGYDYDTDGVMTIFVSSFVEPDRAISLISQVLSTVRILGNDLSNVYTASVVDGPTG